MWFWKQHTVSYAHFQIQTAWHTSDAVGRKEEAVQTIGTKDVRRKTITKANPRNICSLSVCVCVRVSSTPTTPDTHRRRWMRLMRIMFAKIK